MRSSLQPKKMTAAVQTLGQIKSWCLVSASDPESFTSQVTHDIRAEFCSVELPPPWKRAPVLLIPVLPSRNEQPQDRPPEAEGRGGTQARQLWSRSIQVCASVSRPLLLLLATSTTQLNPLCFCDLVRYSEAIQALLPVLQPPTAPAVRLLLQPPTPGATPELRALLSNRSLALLKAGKTAAAAEDAAAAVRLSPGWHKGHWRLAKALCGLGRCVADTHSEANRLCSTACCCHQS